MIQSDNEDKKSDFLINFLNKIISIFLIFISISLFLIMFSFNPDDTGWGFISNKTPSNLYQQYGAWVAGFIIRELGIVTGVLMTLVCLNWSFKLLNKTLINHLKFKLLSFILMVFLSSIGGAYLEKIIILYLGLNFDVINQTGLPQKILLDVTNQINLISNLEYNYNEAIFGISAFLTSIIIFLWVSSINSKEINVIKLIIRPFILPFIWVLSILYNLFFKSYNIDEGEILLKEKNLNLKTSDFSATKNNNYDLFIQFKQPNKAFQLLSLKETYNYIDSFILILYPDAKNYIYNHNIKYDKNLLPFMRNKNIINKEKIKSKLKVAQMFTSFDISKHNNKTSLLLSESIKSAWNRGLKELIVSRKKEYLSINKNNYKRKMKKYLNTKICKNLDKVPFFLPRVGIDRKLPLANSNSRTFELSKTIIRK